MSTPYQGNTIFADGMIVKRPKEGTPEWIKLNFSFKVDEFTKFLKANAKNGWVNCDMKKSKEGKLYVALNNFEPKKRENDLPKGEFDEVNEQL